MKISKLEMERIRESINFRKDLINKAMEITKHMNLPKRSGYVEFDPWYNLFIITSTELYRLGNCIENLDKRLTDLEHHVTDIDIRLGMLEDKHDGFVEESAGEFESINDYIERYTDPAIDALKKYCKDLDNEINNKNKDNKEE